MALTRDDIADAASSFNKKDCLLVFQGAELYADDIETKDKNFSQQIAAFHYLRHYLNESANDTDLRKIASENGNSDSCKKSINTILQISNNESLKQILDDNFYIEVNKNARNVINQKDLSKIESQYGAYISKKITEELTSNNIKTDFDLEKIITELTMYAINQNVTVDDGIEFLDTEPNKIELSEDAIHLFIKNKKQEILRSLQQNLINPKNTLLASINEAEQTITNYINNSNQKLKEAKNAIELYEESPEYKTVHEKSKNFSPFNRPNDTDKKCLEHLKNLKKIYNAAQRDHSFLIEKQNNIGWQKELINGIVNSANNGNGSSQNQTLSYDQLKKETEILERAEKIVEREKIAATIKVARRDAIKASINIRIVPDLFALARTQDQIPIMHTAATSKLATDSDRNFCNIALILNFQLHQNQRKLTTNVSPSSDNKIITSKHVEVENAAAANEIEKYQKALIAACIAAVESAASAEADVIRAAIIAAEAVGLSNQEAQALVNGTEFLPDIPARNPINENSVVAITKAARLEARQKAWEADKLVSNQIELYLSRVMDLTPPDDHAKAIDAIKNYADEYAKTIHAVAAACIPEKATLGYINTRSNDTNPTSGETYIIRNVHDLESEIQQKMASLGQPESNQNRGANTTTHNPNNTTFEFASLKDKQDYLITIKTIKADPQSQAQNQPPTPTTTLPNHVICLARDKNDTIHDYSKPAKGASDASKATAEIEAAFLHAAKRLENHKPGDKIYIFGKNADPKAAERLHAALLVLANDLNIKIDVVQQVSGCTQPKQGILGPDNKAFIETHLPKEQRDKIKTQRIEFKENLKKIKAEAPSKQNQAAGDAVDLTDKPSTTNNSPS